MTKEWVEEALLVRYPKPEDLPSRTEARIAYQKVSEGTEETFLQYKKALEDAVALEASARAAFTGAVMAESERTSQYAMRTKHNIAADTVRRMLGKIPPGQTARRARKLKEQAEDV